MLDDNNTDNKKKLTRGFIGDFSGYSEKTVVPINRKEDKLVVATTIFLGMVMAATSLLKQDLVFGNGENEPVNKTEKTSYQEGFISGSNSLKNTIEKTDKEVIARKISRTWGINSVDAINIVDAVYSESKKNKLDPALMFSVIAKESSFNKNAVSVTGDNGLMQINYKWHKDKITKEEIYDVKKNIATGAIILKECIDKSDGDIKMGLQRYNGSHLDSKMSYSSKVLAFYGSFAQDNNELLNTASAHMVSKKLRI